MGTSQKGHSFSRQRKALADAVAGLVASLVALWAFYPLDVFKINFQAEIPVSSYTMKNMYRGVLTKSLHCASSSFIYFYLYSFVTTWWIQKTKTTKISTLSRLLLSAVAAILNTTITFPLDAISSKQQTSIQSDGSKNNVENISSGDEEGKLCDEGDSQQQINNTEEERKDETEPKEKFPSSISSKPAGNSSMWKGLVPSLLLCSNPSIQYTVFELLKTNIIDGRSDKLLNLREAFITGLIAKLVATIATYPLIQAKVMLMLTHQKSLLGTMVREYKNNGILGLYKGCNLQVAHTILKSALLMMIREKITATTNSLITVKM
mmetsp:Transcript_7083/g.10331  ORF Transcript_7083/g.10331 Transcript_7083/m.10331 type:complete len:321 (+) Transcript_7083:148-1110(+)